MIAEHAADRFSSRAVVSLAVLCGFVVGALKCVGILTAALYGWVKKEKRTTDTSSVSSPVRLRLQGTSVDQPAPGASVDSPRGVMLQLYVLGGQGVGKTTVTRLFLKETLPDTEKPTVGMDLHYKTLWIGQQKAWLQVWDTSGSVESNRELRDKLKKAHGCVMVYDQQHPETCAALETWRNQILGPALQQDTGYPLAVLGNQTTPLHKPQASTDKPREVPNGSLNSVRNVNAAAFCKQHSIAHFQMGTCRDMDAAAAAFQHVIRSAVHRLC